MAQFDIDKARIMKSHREESYRVQNQLCEESRMISIKSLDAKIMTILVGG